VERLGNFVNMRQTVAVIDSDATTLLQLRGLLSNLDVEVQTFDNAECFLLNIARAPNVEAPALDCVITEVILSGMSGVQLLQRLRAVDANLPVVLVAAEPDIPTAVSAMRQGATDFIEKSQLDVQLLRRVTQLLHKDARRAKALVTP
jgi:FixJ family two-component response regulator